MGKAIFVGTSVSKVTDYSFFFFFFISIRMKYSYKIFTFNKYYK